MQIDLLLLFCVLKHLSAKVNAHSTEGKMQDIISNTC